MVNRKLNETDAHQRVYANPGLTSDDTIAAGTPINLGDRYGIAHQDIVAPGGSGTVYTKGVFKLAKATGSGTALTRGTRVSWDATNDRVSAWKGGASMVVWEDCADGDASVLVDLEDQVGRYTPYRAWRAATSGEAAANSADGQMDFDTGFGAAIGWYNVMVINHANGLQKSAFKVEKLTGGDLGKIRVSGVASGTQIDEGNLVYVEALPNAL